MGTRYNIEVTRHYSVDDPECTSDYCAVDVKINGLKVAEYEDAYHDHGYDKALAFVDGFLDANEHVNFVKVDEIQVADYEM